MLEVSTGLLDCANHAGYRVADCSKSEKIHGALN